MIRKLRMFQPSWGGGPAPAGSVRPSPWVHPGSALPTPQDGGLHGALGAGPVTCHPLQSCCRPPNMPQNTYALAASYTCPQPSAVSEHTVEPLTHASS